MTVSHVTISTHGAIFTGQARRDIRKFLDETKAEVAEMGVREIQSRLGSVLKNPSGTYESMITTEQVGRLGDWIIHDQGIIYGPWLEGVSRRNQTTRFKGYKTFRRIRAKLRKIAIPHAQQNLDKLVARWNR